MSGGLVWESPSGEAGDGRRKYAAQEKAMDERPGDWLVVTTASSPTSAASIASRLKSKGYEATIRGSKVYARRPEGWSA